MQSPIAIDVHHHAVPAVYRAALAEAGQDESVPGVGLPDWTPERSLAFLDAAGIRAAVLSITAPGLTGLTDEAARRTARSVNEYFAVVAAEHPGRFGAFAVLPLAEPEAAVAEAEYALDVLGLDGVGMYSSAGGRYLGDPLFAPILELAADRGVPVFVHPVPAAWAPDLGLPVSVLEFPVETARAAVSLLGSGLLERRPESTVILPHAGGVLPYLAHRLTLASGIDPALADRPPADPRGAVRSLWFDTAMSADGAQLAALTALADAQHVVFGSDFPLQGDAYALANAAGHRAAALADPPALDRLFPRLVG